MLKKYILPIAAVCLMGTALPVLAQSHEPSKEGDKSTITQNDKSCAGELNFLPKIVTKEEIDAIKPDAKVSVQTICEGVKYSDFGNVGDLDKAIAGNKALEGALTAQNLKAEDVVGINIQPTAVDLYVHGGQ
jgi:hypothetical protein